MRNYSTFSRTALQPPQEEIRIDVPPNNPWFLFCDTHSEILKIYNLIVNHIISDISPIHLNELRNILKNQYCIPYDLVEDTLQFLIQIPTKYIEFQEKENIRLPLIYKKPRQHVSIVGEYCVWKDNSKLHAKTPEGLER
jgi:hypothetical protein